MTQKEPGKNTPPPFLELSHSTIYALQGIAQAHTSSSVIDIDNVLTLWTTLANSSEYIRNGQRLENISWRVVNRSILHKQKFSSHDFFSLLQISMSSPEACRDSLWKQSQDLKLRQANHRIESVNLSQGKGGKEMLEESSKDMLKESSKESLKGSSKEMLKELSKEMLKESSKEMLKESSKESSKETLKASSQIPLKSSQTPSLFQSRKQLMSRTCLQASSGASRPSYSHCSHSRSSRSHSSDSSHSSNSHSSRSFLHSSSQASLQTQEAASCVNAKSTPLTRRNLRKQDERANSNGLSKKQNSINRQLQKQMPRRGQQDVPSAEGSQTSLFQRQSSARKRYSTHTILPEALVVANHSFLKKQVAPNRLGRPQEAGGSGSGPLDDQTRHLYEQQRKYNGQLSPKSDTQKSQVSLFGPPRRIEPQEIDFSSSDDSSDDSGWSSLSDDSEFDDDDVGRQSDRLLFEKKALGPSHYETGSGVGTGGTGQPGTGSSPAVPSAPGRKSLLSGLFLDGRRANAPALNTPMNQRQRERRIREMREESMEERKRMQNEEQNQRKKGTKPKGTEGTEGTPRSNMQNSQIHQNHMHPTPPQTSPKLVYANEGFPDGRHSKVGHGLPPGLPNSRATARASAVTTAVPKFVPPENARELLKRHSETGPKSAISLASFFTARRNSQHPEPGRTARASAIEPSRYDLHHHSNAPPTATTLLPTALATHMFLPTMSLRQQARARHREPNQLKLAALSHRHAVSPPSGNSSRSDLAAGPSSVKTNTSSIDIPGSQKQAAGDLPDTQGRSSSGASARRSNSSASRMSAKSTRLEMLSKELPLKLMDSIKNENRLLYSGAYDDFDSSHRSRSRDGRQAVQEGTTVARAGSHAEQSGTRQKGQQAEAAEKTTLQKGGQQSENDDEDDDNDNVNDNDNDNEANSNIIADGIMGNKLKFFHSHRSGMHKALSDFSAKCNGLHRCKNTLAPDLLFSDDGYVDDRLIRLKAQVNGVVSRRDDEDWDADDLSYHARGW
ncbi:hypothetical protein BRETT_000771 [Brettanomyces bruxellensis]|uniref:Nitrogen regulatory protein areA GATA-like domain-containing protein n=1 Tax=Dekkera bruxellensis TaxID=5007 RepID=A0A871R8L7_DEKBR|nr:uncharacterized protein BRETT_000771 [Brettanomyces bruxellensis]QOU21054.1 hypothetical protein BRETT_000771 [Brettanomyces bruxellensis]